MTLPAEPTVQQHPSLASLLEEAQKELGADRSEEATALARKALSLSSDNVTAQAVVGVSAFNLHHYEEAIEVLGALGQKIQLNETLLSVMARSYRMLCRPEEAAATIEAAVFHNPDDVTNLIHAALILADVDEYDRAFTYLMRASGLDHRNAKVHLVMAQHFLALGEFEIGWREYEWRDFVPNPGNELPPMTSAPWNGCNLPNGHLLIICDQGFGDCLQFVRFLRIARLRCARVILASSQQLLPLFARVEGVDEIHAAWADMPPHAAHCRITSLPYVLGLNRPSDFATASPYLRSDPDLVEHWERRLVKDEKTPRARRVGIVWQGRRAHPNDRRRSLSLAQLAPLAKVAGIRFVCLQKPIPEDDLAIVPAFNGLENLSDDLVSYDDTAALVSSLDLVIAIDSSVAHLSGGLGIPTWILLPVAPDWRWLREGRRSAWYPSVRLYRQTRSGAWDTVIAEVAAALQRWAVS